MSDQMPPVTGADEPGQAPWPVEERLRELFRRLDAAEPPTSADSAFAQLARVLTEVEDAYSGVPNDPSPSLSWDGRMYPPREDHIVRAPDGSITAHTRGHVVHIDADGALRISDVGTDSIVYERKDEM